MPIGAPVLLPTTLREWTRFLLGSKVEANTVGVYTMATLPKPTDRNLIVISDESGGSVLAFSDGTNWRRVTDRAIVS